MGNVAKAGAIAKASKKLIPAKLKHDAIVEALLEIRFETGTVPEVLFGRLADYGPWKSLSQRPMPASLMPAAFRQADPSLRYQPVFGLAESNGTREVRIGPQVLSYHRRAPYVGWEKFSSELIEAIEGLYLKAEGLMIRRLGLRYINALIPDVHSIRSISNLDLKVEIAGEPLAENVNVNFIVSLSEDTDCTVRIATPQFVQGLLPPNTSVVADVDVFTKDGFSTQDKSIAIDWIGLAHAWEKEQFFRLLPEKTIEDLREN